MVVADHVKLLALDLACQRLARRAKALATIGAALDAAKVAEVDRLIASALATLGEESWRPATPEADAKKKPSGNLLLRMLRGKDESAPPPPSRIENAPPSDQHTLALRGEGESIPPPDLLGFLSAQNKTGRLEVVTPTEVYTLEFAQGDVVHAHVNPTIPKQRLGDILVSNGAVAREELERIRDQGLSQRLGEVLLRENLVTREQLIAALQTQVQLLFNRMFAAQVSSFTFWNGPPILADEGMRLNAMALIFEGARTHDETLIVDPRDYPDEFFLPDPSTPVADPGDPLALESETSNELGEDQPAFESESEFEFEPEFEPETATVEADDPSLPEPKTLIAESRDASPASTKASLLGLGDPVPPPDARVSQDG